MSWTPPEVKKKQQSGKADNGEFVPPEVEKKSPDQTTSEDLETGSEVSQDGGEFDQDFTLETPEVGKDIAFGGTALTREEAERQSDIRIPQQRSERAKEAERQKQIAETPMEVIDEAIANSEQAIDKTIQVADSTYQRYNELEAQYQSLKEAYDPESETRIIPSPEEVERFNLLTAELNATAEAHTNAIETYEAAKTKRNAAIADRYTKRSQKGSLAGAMEKGFIESAVDMGAEALRIGAYYNSLVNNYGMDQEDYMAMAEEKIGKASQISKATLETLAPIATGIDTEETTEEFIAENTKEFGLKAGLITIAQSAPMMAGGYTTMFLGMAAEADKMIKEAPGSENLSTNEKMAYQAIYGTVGAALEMAGLQAVLGFGAGGKAATAFTNRVIKNIIGRGEKVTLNRVQRGALQLARSGTAEGLTEVGQESLAIGMEETVNALKDTEVFQPNDWVDVLERNGQAFKMGLNAGLIMGAPTAVVTSGRRSAVERSPKMLQGVTKTDYQNAEGVMDPAGRTDVIGFIENLREEGKISQERADEMVAEVDEFIEINGQMKAGMTTEQKMKAFGLLMKKRALKEQIAQTDEAFLTNENEQLDEVNAELGRIVGAKPEEKAETETTEAGEIIEQEVAPIEENEIGNELSSAVRRSGLYRRDVTDETSSPKLQVDEIDKKRSSRVADRIIERGIEAGKSADDISGELLAAGYVIGRAGSAVGSKEYVQKRIDGEAETLEDIFSIQEETTDQRTPSIVPETEAQSGDYFTREIDGETIVYEQTEEGTARILTPEESEQVLQGQEEAKEVEVVEPVSLGETPEEIQSSLDAMSDEEIESMYQQQQQAEREEVMSPAELEYESFQETGEVSEAVLNDIAYKTVNMQELSPQEQEIAEAKSDQVSEIIETGSLQVEEMQQEEAREAKADANEVDILTLLPKINYESFVDKADDISPTPEFRREYFSDEGQTVDEAREAVEEQLGRPVEMSEVTEAIERAARLQNEGKAWTRAQMEKETKTPKKKENPFKALAEDIRAGKISDDIMMSGLPGFKEAFNAAVEVTAQAVEAAGTVAQQYKVFMDHFTNTEFWKGLSKSQQDRADRFVKEYVGVKIEVKEDSALRKARRKVNRAQEQLDAHTMSGGTLLTVPEVEKFRRQKLQGQKEFIAASMAIGKDLPVTGVKEKIADVKSKMQEKLTAVRKELRAVKRREETAKERAVSPKDKKKIKKLDDLSKIKRDLSDAIKDILPKGGVVSRSIAQAISEADTVKKMERVIERIEKMNRRSQEKQEAEARKNLISDIDKFTNPKNFAYKRKGRSLAKSKISPEAQRELRKLREEYDADKLAEISDAELVALHEMVSGVFENGRIAQRDFNKWRTQVNRDLKNRFTEIVADKKGAAKPVTTVEDAIAELEKKNIVIIGDKRYSSTMIDQFKADFGVEGELDGKIVVIPSQRGQNKKRVLGYYGRTLDFLSQMYAFISDNASKRWVEENLYRPIAIASKRVTEARFDMAKNERNLKKKIFGSSKKGRRKLLSNAGIDIVDLNGEKLMDRFTNDHAIYLFNVIQRVDMYRKALAAGISEESLDALVDYVNSDKQLKAYAEGMVGLYQDFLPSVNEALERTGEQTIEGKKIPSQEALAKRTSPGFAENYYRRMREIYGEVPETEPYTPASVLGSEIGSMQDMRILGQPENAISVVSNNAIDVKAGGELQVASNLQLYDSWVEGMANMREKLDLAKTFNAVFNKQNMNLIEKNYGKAYADALRENIDTMLAGRRIDRLTSLEQWLNSASGVTMFINVSSSIFQQLSKFNFGLGEGLLPQYIANWGKAYWSKDYKEARSEVSNASWVRARLLGDLSSIELAELKQSNTKYQRYLSEVLSKGYILTKGMDINAIISGGTPYYMAKRDQYFEKYSKEMNSSEAMEKAKEEAMNDLYIKTQEAQQSSEMFQRSSEQNNTFKRFLLTFGSVNLQYARVTMRAARDIKNGRGNTAENLAIILYYSAIQQAAFQFLSRAFSSWFLGDDDEEEKNAKQTYWKVANGTLNSFLSGMGAMGAIAAVTKDVLFDAAVSLTSDTDKEMEESLVKDLRSFLKDQGMSDEDLKGKRVDQLVYTATRSVAPNVGSKISGMRSMLYDFSNDRPLRGTGELIQFATNIPASRLVDLSDQVVDAMDSDLESMDRTLRLFNIVKKYDLDKKYGREKKDLFEKDEDEKETTGPKRSSSL